MGFQYVILNGKKRPAAEAKVSLFSPALFSSFGVYESVEVIEGIPFHLRDHLSRLAESAEMIELSLPYGIDDIASWVNQLIRENGNRDCILRIIALGVTQAEDEALVTILPQPLPHYPDNCYSEGATAIIFEGSRALPACKSLNTLVNYLARRQAIRAGVHEAILRTGGEMTEGSRSNIFAVCQEEIRTPPADRVLSGITRDITIRLALEAGYRVSETPLNLMDLSHFDEFFITSTSMHVIPIVCIGDVRVGEGHVGQVTLDLMDRFERYHHDYISSRNST
jgi:branched-subunit amino acid aminotransferase/4-amino-4-deoxychorismate lyase